MTPNTKAQELFDRYFSLRWQEHKSTRTYKITSMSKSAAKTCALITIEEILSSIVTQAWSPAAHKYWYEVKLELEKL